MDNLTSYLDAVAQRAEAATPGPWEGAVAEEDDKWGIRVVDEPVGFQSIAQMVWKWDVHLIAHARTDLPLLVQMLRLAHEALVKTRERIEHATSASSDQDFITRQITVALADLDALAAKGE